MNIKPVTVTWPNGTTSNYESEKECAKELNVTILTIRNYLKFQNAPMKIKFEFSPTSGYERLLRHVMKKFGNPRKIKLTLENE